MSLGERIRKLRKRLGLTQKEFAGRVVGKVDYTYIGRMERGEQYPSLKMLEKVGKAFSVPLSYFFEDDSTLKSLDLLPGEIKDILKDKRRQDLLKISKELNPRDLGLVIQIINILAERKPMEGLYLAEPGLEYLADKKKRKDLIDKIETALSSSPKGLSMQEDWLRETLQIALKVLKGSPG
jgi:transcriptional regulator with XRE-family HTH domain